MLAQTPQAGFRIELSGAEVLMPQKFLHLVNRHPRIQQERRHTGPECGLTGFVADRHLIILRDLPKTCWRQLYVSVRRKIGEKTDGATLSGRTIFLSMEARFSVRTLFLPHNMAAARGQPLTGKKGKKGHATLCGRTFCVIVLY